MPHPRTPRDLVLAPVAVEIDQNLQRLRDLNSEQIITELELELDRPEVTADGSDERRARILEAALRNVSLHTWHAVISDDGARLHLQGGSVALDLGLSASITRFIEGRGADGAPDTGARKPGWPKLHVTASGHDSKSRDGSSSS